MLFESTQPKSIPGDTDPAIRKLQGESGALMTAVLSDWTGGNFNNYVDLIYGVPLGPATVSAAIRRAFPDAEVRFMPLGWRKDFKTFDFSDVFTQVAAFDPDVIGMTNNEVLFEKEVRLWAGALRRVVPRATLVLGGLNATLRSEHHRQSGVFDYIVRGEGERAIVEVINEVQAGQGPRRRGACQGTSQETRMILVSGIGSYVATTPTVIIDGQPVAGPKPYLVYSRMVKWNWNNQSTSEGHQIKSLRIKPEE